MQNNKQDLDKVIVEISSLPTQSGQSPKFIVILNPNNIASKVAINNLLIRGEFKVPDGAKSFLIDEFYMFSFTAAVQHNGIYSGGSEMVRRSFKETLKKVTTEILDGYCLGEISELQHIANIMKLQSASEQFANILINNMLNIGTVQKILNLNLKYWWCAGWLKSTPPHGPIDAIVLNSVLSIAINNEISGPGVEIIRGCRWTRIATIDEYKEVISAIRVILNASGITKSLADWELEQWSNGKRK